MLPEPADVAARVENLRAILFTEFTATGLVLALVLAGAGRRLSADGRERLVVAASLATVTWFAGPMVALVACAWALTFAGAVELGVTHAIGRLAVAVLIAVLVVAPVAAIGRLGEPAHAREFVAFATNMALLRCIWWARARRRGDVASQPIGRVFLALFFFPTFVNGPVETPGELARPLDAPTGADVWAGLARAALGVAKIAAVALLLPPNWTRVLANGPEAPAAALWGWAVALYVWFYLSFSAWTDVAIGFGLLCGRRVRENFDRPWLARDPSDLWRRWHVSFGLWLRDVVYVPLGGNRRHRARNVVAVFAVSAAWHVWGTLKLLGFGYYPPRAWIGFAVWGLLHAIAVIVFGGRRRPREAPAGIPIALVPQLATFLFASFAWVPFFTSAEVSWTGLARMLARMVVPIVP
jgi:hypothetical protein